jgi:hypothetical protein
MRAIPLIMLGFWLGLLVASWVFATSGFRTVDRILGESSRPELQERLAPLPADGRRTVLRHAASEANRSMFRAMSIAELVLGAVVVVACWRLGTIPRALALTAAAVVLAQAAALGPAILRLGRAIDFVPRPLPADVARRFGILHAGYMLADLVKAGALVAAAWLITRRAP